MARSSKTILAALEEQLRGFQEVTRADCSIIRSKFQGAVKQGGSFQTLIYWFRIFYDNHRYRKLSQNND